MATLLTVCGGGGGQALLLLGVIALPLIVHGVGVVGDDGDGDALDLGVSQLKKSRLREQKNEH